MFKLAVSLHSLGYLDRVVTGYPKFKLVDENLPFDKIESHSLLQIADFGVRKLNLKSPIFKDLVSDANLMYLDQMTSKRIKDSNLISMSSVSLYTARKVKARGNKFIVNRSSFHILKQKEILADAAERWRWPEEIPSEFSIRRELEEYELADTIVVPSVAAYESFISANIQSRKLLINPFPVDIQREEVSETKRTGILFVGNVTLQKGFPTLIQAFNKLANPDLKLNVVGAFSPKFIKHLSRAGLDFQNVIFHGHLNKTKLAMLYRSNDLFVLPSIHDGWGMVVNEAMSYGCIPIVSNGAGAAQQIQPGENGQIFKAGDVNELLDKIQLSLGNEQLRYQLKLSLTKKLDFLRTWDDFARIYIDF